MSRQNARGVSLRLVLTVAVVLGVVLMTGVGLTRKEGGDKLRLVAHFENASPLLPGNDVRSHGVKVGIIDTIEVEGTGAEVVIELDEGALPVHEDATLTIRPVSLLGERFVDLDPGTPKAPLMADGGELGVDATGATVGLDELVNTLDAPTSASMGLLVNALGVGLDGNGKNAREAISALAPALTRTSELTQVLADQNTTLARLVETMEPVASGMATDDGQALDTLVASTEQLLAAAAADDDAFRAMIAELPGTLRAARSTLGNLEATADSAAPTLAKLRPTTSQLDELSRELEAFAAVADPALRSSVPVLRKAEALLQAARPVAAALRAAGPSTRAAATSAQPLSRELAGRFTGVMEFFKGWALTTNGSDGLSHYFRANLVLSPATATGLLPAAPTGTGTSKTGTKTGELLPGVTDLLDGLLPGIDGLLADVTDKDGGVTGLTDIQELDALGFLLGGN